MDIIENISNIVINFIVNFLKTFFYSVIRPVKFYLTNELDDIKIEQKLYLYTSIVLYMFYVFSHSNAVSLADVFDNIDRFSTNISSFHKFLLTIPVFIYCLLLQKIVSFLFLKDNPFSRELSFRMFANTLLIEISHFFLIKLVVLSLGSFNWDTWQAKFREIIKENRDLFNFTLLMLILLVQLSTLVRLIFAHTTVNLFKRLKLLPLIILPFFAENTVFTFFKVEYQFFGKGLVKDVEIYNPKDNTKENFRGRYYFDSDTTVNLEIEFLMQNNSSHLFITDPHKAEFLLRFGDDWQYYKQIDIDTVYQGFYHYADYFDSIHIINNSFKNYLVIEPNTFKIIKLVNTYKLDTLAAEWLNIVHATYLKDTSKNTGLVWLEAPPCWLGCDIRLSNGKEMKWFYLPSFRFKVDYSTLKNFPKAKQKFLTAYHKLRNRYQLPFYITHPIDNGGVFDFKDL